MRILRLMQQVMDGPCSGEQRADIQWQTSTTHQVVTQAQVLQESRHGDPVCSITIGLNIAMATQRYCPILQLTSPSDFTEEVITDLTTSTG